MAKFKIRDRRDKGWFYLDNEYLNGYGKIFGPVGTAVYVSLCRHADSTTQSCYPSMQQIAEENGIHRETVAKYINIFEKHKIIEVLKEYDKLTKKRKTNIYILLDKSIWKSHVEQTDMGSHVEMNGKSHVERFDSKETHKEQDSKIVEPKVSTDIISNKTMNKIYAYDENRFSDDQEQIVNYDTGEVSRGKPKEKVSDELRSQAKLFFTLYQDLFSKLILTGFRPELATRSPKLLVPTYSALKRYGFERLKTMLEIYMNDDNKYYKSQGWNIYTFLSNRALLELEIKAQAQNGNI